MSAFAQSCPEIHIFGARETTAPAGYGTAGTVVNLIKGAYPGATSEAISYPACGGQSSCGGASYSSSALQGTQAVANAVNSFHQRCPNTKIVLVGYSQGGQIVDNAFCGGGDTNIGLSNTATPINASALNMVKAAIMMGSPRFRAGAPYNVGSCSAQGFAPRPAGWTCPSGSKVKSYCDSADPYCCTGNDQNTHQGYGNVYGQNALNFVKQQLNSSGGSNPTPQPTTSNPGTQPTQPPTNGGGSGSVAKWGQCGGNGYSGPTSCVSGSSCQKINDWYSQCL
ncbi:putative acetyl xylan esterase [Ascobolus immersus RN42]|uniref:Putative acetyl xylan esterase n=1 Tax=Ascobolus immersus RN42 TaxID=1160509 RepID=A0A3N4I1Z3_ASCIM|nr:putative acetyl xylan esterase [Ascobolus immersus RN42]